MMFRKCSAVVRRCVIESANDQSWGYVIGGFLMLRQRELRLWLR